MNKIEISPGIIKYLHLKKIHMSRIHGFTFEDRSIRITR
jgi:hypothetical protein